MKKLTELRELADSVGWRVRKLRTPTLIRDGMLVRYTVLDHHGEAYFSNLDELETKVRNGLSLRERGII